jgi:hypothetical protein
MASEWIGTVVLGLGGIASTLIVAKQGRDHVKRMAREGHERTMAGKGRQQERLGNGYLRLLGLVEPAGQWAQLVKPIFMDLCAGPRQRLSLPRRGVNSVPETAIRSLMVSPGVSARAVSAAMWAASRARAKICRTRGWVVMVGMRREQLGQPAMRRGLHICGLPAVQPRRSHSG